MTSKYSVECWISKATCIHAHRHPHARTHTHRDKYVILFFHGSKDSRTYVSVTLYVYSACIVVFTDNTNIHASAGFEPAIPASDRPQTFALDRSVTGIGYRCNSVVRGRQLTD
jgi:hypothetical protein